MFAIAFAFLFAASIAVQLNDPDPLLWIAIYGVAFVLTVAACFGRFWPAGTAVAIAGYALVFALWSPALLQTSWRAVGSMQMQAAEDEEVREAWGLAICLAWTTALLVRARRASRR